jgi:hypothetical protein
MSERTGTFSKTMSLRQFGLSQKAVAFEVIDNTEKTGKIFGVLKKSNGEEITLAIASKVGTTPENVNLNQDLSVSWFEPSDGAESFYMLHQTGKSNVVASIDFTADLSKV